MIDNESSLNKVVFSICGWLDISHNTKLKLFQQDDPINRIKMMKKLIMIKNEELKMAKDLESKVRQEMARETRNFLLKKQLD